MLLYMSFSQKLQIIRLPGILAACWFTLITPPVFSQSSSDIGLSQAERAYLTDKKVLRVCVDPDRLPFDGVDEKGKHAGLSKDYFEIFSRMLNVDMVLPEVRDWNDLMVKASNRDCDVVSQVNASDDGKSFLDFTSPYFYLPLAVVTRYEHIFIEECLEEAGTQFAVIKGDIAIEKIKQRYPEVNLVEVKNNIEAMHLVHDGEVFGFIGAQGAVAFAIQSLGLNKLAVTGSLPLRYELSVATRNDEPLLGSAFEKAVLHIDPDDAQRIRDKWTAISIEKVTDYTLLWQSLVVLGTILIVSLYWYRSLIKANRKIRKTLSELHDAQEELKQQNRLFRKQSLTDRLTGVYNRIKLDDDIDYAIKRTRRIKSEFSIIILDIDDFKKVNDTFGYLIGDWVLRAVSSLVKKSIRESDIIGRWDGEEFLIICPDTGLEGGQVLAEKLRKRIEEYKFSEIGLLTASFGVAVYRVDEDANTLVARVNKALNRAREGGRNRVETEAD
jgi:diguanylate cyclase (GGDEF)-like protein